MLARRVPGREEDVAAREPMRRMTKTGGGDVKFPGADQLKSDCVFIFI